MIFQLALIEMTYLSSVSSMLFPAFVSWNDDKLDKEQYFLQESESIHFTEEEKKRIVDLHNEYRRNLTPPAANMKYMEWDENLARIAQDWADGCIKEHGNTKDPSVKGLMGQNFEDSSFRDPKLPIHIWFSKKDYYNFSTLRCKSAMKCEQYTQLVWANTQFVGCGLKVNCTKLFKYFVVCNYYPAANATGVHPYKEGVSCSNCSKSYGGFCSDNLCATITQCERYNLKCECNLNCNNSGILNKEECKCKCEHGWDGPDCSTLCADHDPNCNENICSFYETNEDINNPCRKTCNLCNGANSAFNIALTVTVVLFLIIFNYSCHFKIL